MRRNRLGLKAVISFGVLTVALAVFLAHYPAGRDYPVHSAILSPANDRSLPTAQTLNHPSEPNRSPTIQLYEGSAEQAGRTGPSQDRDTPALHDFAAWVQTYLTASPQAKTDRSFLAQGKELARQRRALLRHLIETDPKQALALAVPPNLRENLPLSITELLEEWVSGTGSMDVMVSENFDEGTCKVDRAAHIGGKTYRAFVYGNRLFQKCQDSIPILGIAIDGSLAVQDKEVSETANPHEPQSEEVQRSAARWAGDSGGVSGTENGLCWAESSRTQGTKRLLFMRVAFPDDPTEPISESAAYELMNQVNQWYMEQSYNTTAIIADVTPLLMMPQPKTAYSSLGIPTFLNDARNAARAAGFDTDNYDLDIVRNNQIPGSIFNFAGFAYIGGKGLVLQNSMLYVVLHELGHNYGLWHANYWSAAGDSVIGPGTVVEYGNTFDTMGPQNSNPSLYAFNAEFKNELGWLPSPFVQVVTNCGLYRIYAYDVPNLVGPRKYALCVRRDYARTYWAEFRQKLTSNPWTQNGVLLNWSPWNNPVGNSLGGTVLLDTTPGTPAGNSSKDDAPVVIGRTFSDPAAGIHITPITNGTDGSDRWIDVQVNMGDFPNNSAPTLQITADSTSVPTNIPVRFFAAASDPDGDALAYYWEFGDLTFGSNSPTATKSWSTNGVYVVRCTVSDMKGGLASRNLVITVGSPATFVVTGRVTTPDGQPLPLVRVHNGLTGASYRGSYTDSDGFYVLADMAPGNYTLAAVKYGYSLASAGWTSPVTVGSDLSGLDWLASPNQTVTLTTSDPLAAETGPDQATFILTRSGSLNSPLTVNLNVSGTATYQSDYSLSPAPTVGSALQYTIPAGIASLNITLSPISDSAVEGPETATLTLMENSAYVLAFPAEATVTIADGQPPSKPTVTVSAPDDSAPESGCDVGSFVFRRTGSVAADLEVFYSISGTASNGTDYAPLGGTVTIPAGQTNATVTVVAIDDADVEGDESVTVTVLPNAAYNVGSPASATLTIVDDDPVKVTITATDNIAREGSSDTATFTVTRVGSLAANLVVNYTVSGTASNGLDYVLLPGSVTIPAGQATAKITITPINDNLVEGPETVTVTLAGAPLYNIGTPGQATATIIDDDVPAVTLSASDATASESGPDPGAFTFTRTGSTAEPLTVYFDITGSARNGADYEAITNSIVIPAGCASAVLTITPIDDAIKEDGETVVLTLMNSPTGSYSVSTTTPKTVTIQDNDSDAPVGVSFFAANSSGLESQFIVSLSVCLSTASSVPVSVNYEVKGGTATSGVDFVFDPPSPLYFAPGQVTKTVTAFGVNNDTIVEPDETVIVSLSNPQNALLDVITNHVYTIIDDDGTGTLTVTATDPNAAEAGQDTGTFRISRSGAASRDVTVFYQLTGSASSPSDYYPVASSVTIPAGQTSTNIVIVPVDDDTPEPPETVVLTIVSTTGATIGSPKSATITIADNDSSESLPIVSVVADDPIAAEPGTDTGRFIISRDRGTNAPLTVNFTVGGTATSGTDYEALGTSVTIPAGAWSVPVTVVPRDDTAYEGNETVVLRLTIQGTCRVAPNASSATVTIADNEIGVSVASTGVTTEDGSNVGAFIVSRLGPTDSSLTVNVSVNGTASKGVDYVPIPEAVTFPAGTNTVKLDVLPLADIEAEGTETVLLSILPGSGYSLVSPTNAVVFILDTGTTNLPPTITVQPQNQIVTEGCDATFSVTATGIEPLFYQWYFNATNPVPGGTNSVLVVQMVQDSHAGFYSVVVSNLTASVTSSNALLVVNHRPLPASPVLERLPGAGLKFRATTLLGTDPDGDPIFLSSIVPTSAQGGTVATNEDRLAQVTWVTYLPPAGLTGDDSFDYIVGDGRGGFTTGTAIIRVVTNMAPNLNVTWVDNGDGSLRIDGNGIPGRSYTIEYTESLTEPDWQPLATSQADFAGFFSHADYPPPGSPSRFYRARTE